jgi:hypothetical protein
MASRFGFDKRGERDIGFVIGCPFRGVWVVVRSEREGKAV